MNKHNFDIATQVVHAGGKDEAPNGQPTATPIYAAATYTYESMDQMDKVFGAPATGTAYDFLEALGAALLAVSLLLLQITRRAGARP